MKIMKLILVASLLVSSMAFSKNCKVELEASDSMQFNKKEITVSSKCKKVTVNLKHTGKLPKTAMGHNFVLSLTSDSPAVISAGMKAGPGGDYTPKGAKVIAASELIGGGKSTSVTFTTPKKGGDYTFVCTFPGHSAIMRGKFIVK